MNDLVTRAETAPVEAVTPAQLLALAVQKGDLAFAEKLMDLKERYDRAEAKRAYDAAMADFKATAPNLAKTKLVRFGSGDKATHYKHAELDKITQTLAPLLARYGLSHSWRTAQDGTAITVTCRIAHRDGHSEEVSLTAGPDTSGSKNAIQAVGSAVTYLSRYTLLAITGLATGTEDNDGAPPADEPMLLDATRMDRLAALLERKGLEEAPLLAWAGNIPTLSAMTPAQADKAIANMEARPDA